MDDVRTLSSMRPTRAPAALNTSIFFSVSFLSSAIRLFISILPTLKKMRPAPRQRARGGGGDAGTEYIYRLGSTLRPVAKLFDTYKNLVARVDEASVDLGGPVCHAAWWLAQYRHVLRELAHTDDARTYSTYTANMLNPYFVFYATHGDKLERLRRVCDVASASFARKRRRYGDETAAAR